MAPRIDTEANDFGRPYEQPVGRFGTNHIPRDGTEAYANAGRVPELQEVGELTPMERLRNRQASIAVADTVQVTTSPDHFSAA